MKKFIALTIALILLFLSVPAFAEEQYYHRGNAYNSYLGGTDRGGSTVVISTGVKYYKAAGNGEAALRIWSRNKQVMTYLGYPTDSYNWADAIRYYARFGSGNNQGSMTLGNTSPVPSTSSPTIGSILFDYMSVYDPAIQATYAFIDVASKYISNATGIYKNGYGNQIEIEVRGSALPIELEPSYSYSNADTKMDSNPNVSGSYTIPNAGVTLFQFGLNPAVTPYPIEYRGRVSYKIWHDMDNSYAGSYTIDSGTAILSSQISGS